MKPGLLPEMLLRDMYAVMAYIAPQFPVSKVDAMVGAVAATSTRRGVGRATSARIGIVSASSGRVGVASASNADVGLGCIMEVPT